MKPLYRNIFLVFGLLAIGFMAYGFRADFATVTFDLGRLGTYLPAIIGVPGLSR